MDQPIQQRADFGLIRYANCWEDADILCEALQPGPDKRMLSIASAGDNALALLATGSEVVAADLSAAQLACVELRCAGFRQLAYEELLQFLGLRASANRWQVYESRLAGDLSEDSRQYWDQRQATVTRGVIHAGKFEDYFKTFRTRVIPWIHRNSTVEELLAEKDSKGRLSFYDSTWNNMRWRMLFRIFFSRFVMGRLGRDPEFFRYVEGSVSDRILARTRHALTVLPTHDNPYLNYILTGNYRQALPRYLRPELFDEIHGNLDRLTLFRGSIQDAAREHAADGFDGFNLSDIFEYLSPEICHSIYEQLLTAARPGARLAYWNMLVPRRCPAQLDQRVKRLDQLAERLFQQDLAFFYSAFIVEEVS